MKTLFNQVVFLFALIPSAASFGQSSSYVDGNVKRTVAWDEMVDTVVHVDGLAWGAYAKGLGAHLVLPHGKVYLREIDLLRSDLNGRLLSVSGVLRKARIKKAPRGSQGYSSSFDYFYIDVLAIDRIQKLRNDQLTRSKHDWIVPGMPFVTAREMIRSRQLRTYSLAITASPDGSKTHSYRINKNEVLVFGELNRRITSVVKIELNEIGKGNDKWVPIRGYRLPPMKENASPPQK